MATYPGGIPNLTNPAGTDPVNSPSHAAQHANANDEIEAIATELGTSPKGPYASSVRNRFEILDWKRSVRAASTANVTGTYATGPPATKAVGGTSLTIDGVTMANGDRVFLKDQTSAFENGIYQVSGIGTSVVLTRTYDADDTTKLSDACYVSIEQGAVAADTTWELITDSPITMGTTALRYTRINPPHNGIYGFRSPWAAGATATARPVIAENMPRTAAISTVTPATTATLLLAGGMVIPAGRLITNINYVTTAAASGTLTIDHISIVSVASGLVLQRTANNTTSPGSGVVVTRALQATLTLDADTPVWIAHGYAIGTTAQARAGCGVNGSYATAMWGVAPAICAASATTPTTTPPTVGSSLTPTTTGNNNWAYYYLT